MLNLRTAMDSNLVSVFLLALSDGLCAVVGRCLQQAHPGAIRLPHHVRPQRSPDPGGLVQQGTLPQVEGAACAGASQRALLIGRGEGEACLLW